LDAGSPGWCGWILDQLFGALCRQSQRQKNDAATVLVVVHPDARKSGVLASGDEFGCLEHRQVLEYRLSTTFRTILRLLVQSGQGLTLPPVPW